MDDRDLERLAADCLTRPDSFAQFGGRDDYFEVWGFSPISRHRDSDALGRANWETITKDFEQNADAENWEVFGANHWAVGWIDHLSIRVLVDADRGIVADNLTAELRRVADWLEALADYPVADDETYSRIEWEELEETLTNCYDIGADDVAAVAGELFDSYSVWRADDLREEWIAEALAAVRAAAESPPQSETLF